MKAYNILTRSIYPRNRDRYIGWRVNYIPRYWNTFHSNFMHVNRARLCISGHTFGYNAIQAVTDIIVHSVFFHNDLTISNELRCVYFVFRY